MDWGGNGVVENPATVAMVVGMPVGAEMQEEVPATVTMLR
jgi:hypothetical protein